jgi:hypothetical protein
VSATRKSRPPDAANAQPENRPESVPENVDEGVPLESAFAERHRFLEANGTYISRRGSRYHGQVVE